MQINVPSLCCEDGRGEEANGPFLQNGDCVARAHPRPAASIVSDGGRRAMISHASPPHPVPVEDD